MTADPRAMAEILRMASIYRKRNYHDLAIRLLKGAIDTSYADEESLAMLTFELAEAYSDEGNFFAARQLYRKAVNVWERVHPESSQHPLSYAEILVTLQELSSRCQAQAEYGSSSGAA